VAEAPEPSGALQAGWRWIQRLPWPVHRQAHSGYFVILGAATSLGLMVWSGHESFAEASELLAVWVVGALAFYFATLLWHVLRERARQGRS